MNEAQSLAFPGQRDGLKAPHEFTSLHQAATHFILGLSSCAQTDIIVCMSQGLNWLHVILKGNGKHLLPDRNALLKLSRTFQLVPHYFFPQENLLKKSEVCFPQTLISTCWRLSLIMRSNPSIFPCALCSLIAHMVGMRWPQPAHWCLCNYNLPSIC